MPKESKTNAVWSKEQDQQKEKRYSTEKLLKSRYLAGYQPDFARVILTKPAYSLSEAKTALDKALKGGK